MVQDNSSRIKVWPDPSGIGKISDLNLVYAEAGIFTFSQLIFTGKPGARDVHFIFSIQSADHRKIREVFGEDLAVLRANFNFRWCNEGEIQTGDICQTCSAGTYSFTWNSTECHACIDNAV